MKEEKKFGVNCKCGHKHPITKEVEDAITEVSDKLVFGNTEKVEGDFEILITACGRFEKLQQEFDKLPKGEFKPFVIDKNAPCICGCCHSVDYGACQEFELGARCVYCDHGEDCH